MSMPRPSKTKTAKAKTGATPGSIANRALTEQEFERARRVLMRRDPRLGALIKQVGRCCLPDSRGNEPFAGLVHVIMSQQLSGKAADTIYGRVETLAGGRDRHDARVSPRARRHRVARRRRQPARRSPISTISPTRR